MTRLTRAALGWVKLACYLALLMPLVNPSGLIYPHVFGKSLYLYTLLCLALPAYVLLLPDPRFRPRPTPILAGLALLFGVNLLATLTAQAPALSFWSQPGRMTGLWSQLHYLVFFFLLAVFHQPTEWQQFLRFSIAVSLVVAVIALAEAFGPFPWAKMFPSPPESGERSGSLFGNPAFLSTYLLFHFFLILWQMEACRSWRVRLAFGIALAVLVAALDLAASRGALIATFLGLLTYGVIRLFQHGRQVWRWLLALVALSVLALVAVWVAGGKDSLAHLPGIARLSSTSLQDFSVEARLITWRVAWQGLWDHPLLGWGPENFIHLSDRHYDPRLLAIPLDESWFDRAHNQPLEILTTTGFLGLAGYLAFWVLVLRHLLMARRSGSMSAPLLAMGVALILAYQIQNLVLFDHPGSLLMLYVCLAWWQALGTVPPSGPITAALPKVSSAPPFWLLAALYAFGIFLYWRLLIFAPAQASLLLGTAIRSPDLAVARVTFDHALAIPQPFTSMVPSFYARTALHHADKAPQLGPGELALLEGATQALRLSLSQGGASAWDYYLLARLLERLARHDSSYNDPARAAIAAALARSPRRQELHYLKGRSLLRQGQITAGLAVLRAARDLEPRAASAWKEVAVGHFMAGQVDEAIAALVIHDSLMIQRFGLGGGNHAPRRHTSP